MATRSHNIKTQQVSTYLPTPKQERVPPARSGPRTSVAPSRDGKASSAGRGPKRGRATTNQNCKFLLGLTSDYFFFSEGSPTFNHNSGSVNTPQRSNKEAAGEYSRKSVPSPANQHGSKGKTSKRRNDSRGNSANLLRSPALQLDVSKKQ